MGHTITRVDDRSSQCAVGNLVGRPRGCESQYGLDSDIQSFDIEGLEEDLGSLFPILWWIQRRLGLKNPFRHYIIRGQNFCSREESNGPPVPHAST